MDDPQPLSDAEAPRDGQNQPHGLPAPVPPPSDASPQWTTVKYGTEHALQDMMIHVPPRRTTDLARNLWLVFLHGGGWRSPVQTRADILPAAALLSTSPRHAASMSRVAGIASINYALSADAADADLPAGRGYRHPRHLQDATAALRALADLHGVGREGGPAWVLAGHSCGATMAFQLAMGLDADLARGAAVAAPLAVVGLEGLYDLPAAPYAEMFAMAFGPDPGEWARVSPARHAERLNVERGRWMRHVVLGIPGEIVWWIGSSQLAC